MGKLFSNMKTDDLVEAEDRIGGGRQLFPTDVYPARIKMLFVGKSDSGANYATIIADIDGKEYEETIYFTNAAGEHFYKSKDDGKKNQMPGFVTVNELCLVASGSELMDQEFEERQIEVWSYEDKKKVRQARDVAVDMLDKEVLLAIRQATKPKTKKTDKTDSRGKPIYEDTAEDIGLNEIVKSFHAETGATVGEIRKAQKDDKPIEASFKDLWTEKWKGTIQDQRKGAKPSGGSDGAPKSSGADTKPKTSLFGKS